ncbi:MAG: nuclear transport factor 2 family protein [Actinomycetota bacterium]|nr:nuclear transport factor 2 family protein [Actinomycetota bacterium]
MLDEHSRLELVRRHYAAYNAHDIEAQLATLAPEIEIIAFDEAGRVSEHWRGIEEARDFFVGIRAVVGDSRATLDAVKADGDRVFVRLSLSGVLRRTGEEGEIQAVHLHSFSDMGIVRIQTYRPDWRGKDE